MGVFMVVLVAGGALGLMALVVPFAYGRASQGGWGTRRARAEQAGAGPYRDGEVVLRANLGAPWWMRLTAGVSGVWGVLTVFFFAPAGLLFAVMSTERHLVIALAVFLVSVHGFWVGGRLGLSGYRMLRRESLDAVRGLPVHAALHHVAVALVFALAGTVMREGELGWLAAGPCAFGLVMTPLLAKSLRRAQQAYRADPPTLDQLGYI